MKKKDKELEEQPKKRASRSELSLKKVNLDRLQRQLENVLSREALHLLRASFTQKLDRDSSNSACNYLKLIKELRKDESKDLESLSDEELEKLQKNAK